MTTVAIPSPSSDPSDSLRWQRLERVLELCRVYLREPDVTDDGTTLSIVFTPDLTAAEQAIARRLVVLSGLMVITPAEWAAIESDVAACKTYLGLSSPTAAQTAAGLKSLMRVVGAILRS